MADRVVCGADAGSVELPVQTESSGPEPTLQELIDALVDLDLAFERDCRELSKGTLDAASQYRMLNKLRKQHRQRRAPYVHQLIGQFGVEGEEHVPWPEHQRRMSFEG